ncbi:MAG: hypothetical protein LBH32_14265 [Dysgonamonadaceae bacterium]|jgi:tetratricopeptide (TPR) repeat protein|nr:hypothetical protein [Dysgonamonadaceae bacterium]
MVFDDKLYFDSEENEEDDEELYPDFFYEWNENIENGNSPGFYDADEIGDIIEIYFERDEFSKAQHAIDYALKVYPGDEDLINDIITMLNDYERWNDLLVMSEKYSDMLDSVSDSQRLTALLHLAAEEDAFVLFEKLKTKYAGKDEDLSTLYQVMGESLYEMNLYDASISIIEEALKLFGDDIEFFWLQIHCYLQMENKEKVIELGEIISKMTPFDSATWHRLGVIYKDAGEFSRAVDAFEFAQSLGINDKENLIQLIDSYEYNGNYQRALEYAVEYMNFFPNNYLINFVASTICSHMEMWHEAIHFLDKAIRIEPSMDSLYLYKCNYLLNLGEQRKAKLTLLEGIKNTDDPEEDLEKELKRLNDLYPNI